MPHLRIRRKLFMLWKNLHLCQTFSGQNHHYIMIQGNVFLKCSKLKSIITEGYGVQINKSHWVWHIGRLAQKGAHNIWALSYRNMWCTYFQMSTKAMKYIIYKLVEYKTCRHKIKWTTEHKSHWASVLYCMDRWAHMSISIHMKYEQVTWHMARNAIRHVMFKQVGYEACNIYRNSIWCIWHVNKWYVIHIKPTNTNFAITYDQLACSTHTIWKSDIWKVTGAINNM